MLAPGAALHGEYLPAPCMQGSSREVPRGGARAQRSPHYPAQAPVEPNARGWAVRSDNAHQRPAAEGVEEPDELLRDSHVAQEERHRPMRRCVKCL